MSYLDVLFLKDLFPGLLIEMAYSDVESLYGVSQGSMWNIPSGQGRLLQDPDFYAMKIKVNYGTDQLPIIPGRFQVGLETGYSYQDAKGMLSLISTMTNLPEDQQLTLASQIGSMVLVKDLVEQKGVDVRLDNGYALRPAARNGHLEIVKYLVENGADMESQNDPTSATGGEDAVLMAARNGHLAVVQYLVEKGADPDVHTFMKKTPLIWAAQFGHLEVVKYLAEQGADIRAFNDLPLIWADSNGYGDIVRYLASQGVPLSAKLKERYGL